MITPKEQAEKIIEKFMVALHDPMDVLKVHTNKLALKCSFVYVSGMIDLSDRVSDYERNHFNLTENGNYDEAIHEFEFWREVKHQLDLIENKQP